MLFVCLVRRRLCWRVDDDRPLTEHAASSTFSLEVPFSILTLLSSLFQFFSCSSSFLAFWKCTLVNFFSDCCLQCLFIAHKSHFATNHEPQKLTHTASTRSLFCSSVGSVTAAAIITNKPEQPQLPQFCHLSCVTLKFSDIPPMIATFEFLH